MTEQAKRLPNEVHRIIGSLLQARSDDCDLRRGPLIAKRRTKRPVLTIPITGHTAFQML
jgi:hypothetical protein